MTLNDAPLAPGTFVFDTARADRPDDRSFVLERPSEVLAAVTPTGVVEALQRAERAQRDGAWVGLMLTYEAGVALAGLPWRGAASDAVPLAWVGLYDAPSPAPPTWPAPAPLPTWRAGLERDAYTELHECVRDWIHEGDVYQVNLTFPLDAASTASPMALYAALRAGQPVPYGAVAALTDAGGEAGATVLSLSPELFFRIDPRDGGRALVTRPMKGTVRRGRTAEEDRVLREGLAVDPKNRAENLMIVDLLRNDLARVCAPGSVEVPALFDTEAHPTLSQMTSTVTGRLRPDASLVDVFGALFPSGSITGAPKRRAMTRIAELESDARGAYCGTLGYLAPDGTAVFSVAIRTVTMHGGALRANVGSGVTYDSVADDEYRECLLKASFLGPVAPSDA